MARDVRRSPSTLANSGLLVWSLFVLGIAVALSNAGIAFAAGELETVPRQIVFSDGMARQQILVEASGRDLTRDAAYRSQQPSVATVDAFGYVTPIANGTTEITIDTDGRTINVDVRVSGMSDGRSVDFVTDIVPILSRHGCNSGGCHGKAGGQNGFQLSLFGFDNLFDYDAIAKEGRGRRIFAPSTGSSMLLAKATGSSPHGGGARFGLDSEAAQLIQRWIELGAAASSPESPRVVKLHVTPAERILNRDGRQQLAVTAEYSDGSRRDVTRQSEFSSNLDPVAGVDEDGFVTATGQSGEAAIMARYVGHVAVFHAIVPHGARRDSNPDFVPNNYVDELAASKWKKLGLLPSPNSDDSTFLRRVTVDLCGRLPIAEEAVAFVEDKSGSKRHEVIDRLLDFPDFPAYFAMRWGAILRNSRLAGADQASYAFHNWIKDMIARNRPYDEFVRGVVAAAGEWQDAPAINWYWQTRDDQLHSVTADTAQVFLGIRLQCARCHHHPYERWGQEDYYGLAGFFTRLGRKSFGQPPPYFASSKVTTSEQNPLTGKVPEPKFLDGEYGIFTPEDDPRHALIDWMAEPENPFFARVLVNRLWGHFMGRGLVNEVDDMRESNPPSNLKLPGRVDNSRLGRRQGLLGQLDQIRRDIDLNGDIEGLDTFYRDAMQMVTNDKAIKAFDIKQEDEKLREDYGRNDLGQSCLLARRLVEAGVSFVAVQAGGGWDTHGDNFKQLKDRLLPQYDRAVATLVRDLHDRGRQDDVLVMACGEFGRTPRINPGAGRDHWPGAMSVLYAGGGLKMGQVVGSTNEKAEYPTSKAASVGCVLSTMYHTLGVDHQHVFHDHARRPLPVISEGKPIEDLIA